MINGSWTALRNVHSRETREERLTRNVKIIIRRIYQDRGRGTYRHVNELDFLLGNIGGGRATRAILQFPGLRVHTSSNVCERGLGGGAVIFTKTCTQAGYCSGRAANTRGFIGFYSLFGTDAYCCVRFARCMNQTRWPGRGELASQHEQWKRTPSTAMDDARRN